MPVGMNTEAKHSVNHHHHHHHHHHLPKFTDEIEMCIVYLEVLEDLEHLVDQAAHQHPVNQADQSDLHVHAVQQHQLHRLNQLTLDYQSIHPVLGLPEGQADHAAQPLLLAQCLPQLRPVQ